jgi:hypothetical protein
VGVGDVLGSVAEEVLSESAKVTAAKLSNGKMSKNYYVLDTREGTSHITIVIVLNHKAVQILNLSEKYRLRETSMSRRAKITLHDKHVLVHVKGDPLLPQEIELTLLEAARQSGDLDLDIIILREAPVIPLASIVDLYYYAKSLAKVGFWNRLALVFPEEMHDDKLHFFVTTSSNRGICAALFFSLEKAVEWINCGESK